MKRKPTDEELARAQRFRDLPVGDKCYIVVAGIPKVFTPVSLTYVEEWAAEQCELDHQDRTILCVPRHSVEDSGLVARYHGVVLHALDELTEEEST